MLLKILLMTLGLLSFHSTFAGGNSGPTQPVMSGPYQITTITAYTSCRENGQGQVDKMIFNVIDGRNPRGVHLANERGNPKRSLSSFQVEGGILKMNGIAIASTQFPSAVCAVGSRSEIQIPMALLDHASLRVTSVTRQEEAESCGFLSGRFKTVNDYSGDFQLAIIGPGSSAVINFDLTGLDNSGGCYSM